MIKFLMRTLSSACVMAFVFYLHKLDIFLDKYKEWGVPSDCNCRCSIHPTIPDETLSPETKQAILDDFMKGVE